MAGVVVGRVTRSLAAEALNQVRELAFELRPIVLDDIGLKRPSLDDVFLHLTGHRAEDTIATDTDADEELVR